MRIGIVSNSDCFIPLTYTLAAQKLQVCIFFSPGGDTFIEQKAQAFANQHGIPFVVEKQAHDIYRWINDGNFDACFIIGYKRLIQLQRLKGGANRIFNIHFSLLPAYKGPVPLFWQIRNGEQQLGVSIHRLNEKFDEGNVLWKKGIPNQEHLNYQLAQQLLSQHCVEGVFFLLQMLLNKAPLITLDPPGTQISTYHGKPKADDVIIRWKSMSALEICNLIRACNPWNKGAITFYGNQEVKLMDAVVLADEKSEAGKYVPGTIVAIDSTLKICCSDNMLISINMLYLLESFIPAYQGKEIGLLTGTQFENPFSA